MKEKTYKLGELFCGPGGLALGAAFANGIVSKNKKNKLIIKHAWGVDIAEHAIATYNHNIASKYGGKSYCMNSTEFCNLNKDRIKINALAFGFPCNDFSMVGKRKGVNGNFGELYKSGIKIINQDNPFWFVAENVSGINSVNSKQTFPAILNELSESGKHGYDLTTHLYKFEEYGVPQKRHRYIIVGIRKDQKLHFKVPAPLITDETKYKTVSQALNNIPSNAYNHEIKNNTYKVQQRLKYTPPWYNAWYLDELIEMSYSKLRNELSNTLPWYEEEVSKLSNVEIMNEIKDCKLNCTRARMNHIYKRLDSKKPSYTITGSGGGGTHVYHWCEKRSLTNRERARIQTFPDDFKFIGTSEEQRKQIGMAVPPEAAKIIFEAILKTFAGIDYDSIKPNFKV